MIWTERRFWEDIGPDAMAIIECVLADPHSSANCERGGKVLKLILSIYRKNMYDLAVDEEMRVKMNGPHERVIKWDYYTRRWLKVLLKRGPICKDHRALGASQVVARLAKTAQKKSYKDLMCNFYMSIPPRQ